MRRWLKIVIPSLLLAGGAVLCAIRWQAWFGMPAEKVWNGETLDYTFPEWQQDASPRSLDILVLGDVHSRLTRADYDTLAARVPNADALLQVGDWMERGQAYYYQLLLREWTGSALYGLPVIATPGNHEYTKGLGKTLSPVWEHAFPHPDNGPKGVPGVSYYIDMPTLRLIAIDTNPLIRIVDLTRTMTWLREAINTAGERFVVVLMHHPVLSVAKGRANLHLYAAFRHILGDADLVIAGHDHSYVRRTPFVVLNTTGKTKPQHFQFEAQATDTVPAYGVISIDAACHTLNFIVYRLSNSAVIDSLHVTHN